MANALYPKAKGHMLDGHVSLLTATVNAYLINTTAFGYDPEHDSINQVPGGSIVAGPVAMASKTVSIDGVFDAANQLFTAVTGDNVDAVLLTTVVTTPNGGESNESLLLWLDEGSFPITPNGGDIRIDFSSGVDKVFRL